VGLGVSPVLSFFYSGGTLDIKTPQVEHLFKRGGILDGNGIENDYAFTFAGGLIYPILNPQSSILNPQSPIPNLKDLFD
jgi:hypothetical protein